MEHSSISKLGRQSLISARSKGRKTDIVRRGINQVVESGRRHEFSLDSLDKEILQTMSRGSKDGHGSVPSDSASESSGSAQEKTICSSESPYTEPVLLGYASPEYKRYPKTVMPNGLHSSESTPKIAKKPSDQHHGTRNTGQFHTPTLTMCPEADVRPNGHKQVSLNVNGGKHQQDPGHWHHSGGALHHSGGNNKMHATHIKDVIFRDAHYVTCNQDAEVSSSNSGEENGEETRRKQASEGPYSGSMGLGVPSVLHSAGRESWVDAAALGSARGVKREGPVMDPANMQPRKKVETTARVVVGLDKCKRPSDQADHILRERQRRDDMTSKFSVLESLLPSGPKVIPAASLSYPVCISRESYCDSDHRNFFTLVYVHVDKYPNGYGYRPAASARAVSYI